MKIKEMTKEEKRKYNRKKVKIWRKNNRKKDLISKEKWRKNHKKQVVDYYTIYNKIRQNDPEYIKYQREYRASHYQENQKRKKHTREYMRKYIKEYLKNQNNYEKYLIRQEAYHTIRRQMLILYPSCQKCHSKTNLELHHIRYNNSMKDLMVLCKKCHGELHRQLNKYKEVKKC